MALLNPNTGEYIKIISARIEPLEAIYYRFPNQQMRIDWEAGILSNYIYLDLKGYNSERLRVEFDSLASNEKSIIDNIKTAAYEAMKNDPLFIDWVDA